MFKHIMSKLQEWVFPPYHPEGQRNWTVKTILTKAKQINVYLPNTRWDWCIYLLVYLLSRLFWTSTLDYRLFWFKHFWAYLNWATVKWCILNKAVFRSFGPSMWDQSPLSHSAWWSQQTMFVTQAGNHGECVMWVCRFFASEVWLQITS